MIETTSAFQGRVAERERGLSSSLIALALMTSLSAFPATASAQTSNPEIEPSFSDASARELVFDLPIASGGDQRILYATPTKPWATIVMMPGGSGDIGIERNGDLRHGDNFVVRTRSLWTQQGVAVLIPDALDHQDLRGLRSSSSYGAVVDTLLAFARSKSPGPVFLLGTSQGSIAAMNGAAHAQKGVLAGLILTESVSRLGGSHETVFDADPQDVRVPALIVANREDDCFVAPPQDAPKIAQALSGAPNVDVLYVSGGVYRSERSCGSLTPHGYYGIAPEVVGDIVKWMRANVH